MIPVIKFVYVNYYLGHSGVVAFLSLYLAGLGLSGREIGALIAAGPLAGLLVHPAWSLLADRKGGIRGALLAALSGAVVASLLLPLGQTYGSLILLITVWALFFNGIDPLLNSLALNLLGKRPDGFGRIRLYGSFGNAASQVAIGWLTQIVHAAAMFYWQAFCLFLSFLGIFAIRVERPAAREKQGSLYDAFRSLGGNRAFLSFLLSAFLLQTSQIMGWSYFALYAEAGGANPLQAGVGLWIAVVSAFPFFYLGEALLGRFGPRRLLVASALAYALRWGMLSAFRQVPAIYAVQLLNGFCYGLYYIAAVAFVHRETPAPLKTTGQGLLSAVHISLATICGGMLGGLLIDWGDVTWIYRVAAGLAMLSLIPLVRLVSAHAPAAQSGQQTVAISSKGVR